MTWIASTHAVGGAVFLGALMTVGCGGSDDTASPVDSGTPDAPAETSADTTPPPADVQPETAADTTDSADTFDPKDGFTDAEWTIIKTLSPLPAVPKDTTNKFADDSKAALLGQMLFFDKSYSGPIVVGDDGTNGGLGAVGDKAKVSCASCHGGTTMDDSRSKPGNVSLGIDFGTRNAPSLVNSSFYAWTNWGGRFDSQWSLPPAVAENPKNMASSRLAIAHMLYAKYKTEYNAIFPVALDPALDPTATDAARFPATGKPKAATTDPDGPWELMTAADRTIVMRIFANYGKAMQAYVRLLVSRNAPLDKYVAGDFTALSADAKRGLRVFIGKGGCVTCHSGPNLADDKFHFINVPQAGPHVPSTDLARYTDVVALLASALNTSGAYSDDTTTGKLTGLAQVDSMRGQFRTKSLRGVAASAPYMHSGQMATLEDVVTFYDKGGVVAAGDAGVDSGGDSGVTAVDPLIKPLGLAGTEAADLIAFLKGLTGEAVPAALLKDTSK
jgi:cytochrome c peroxidase